MLDVEGVRASSHSNGNRITREVEIERKGKIGRDGEVTFLLELSYCYSYYHVRNYSSGKFL